MRRIASSLARPGWLLGTTLVLSLLLAVGCKNEKAEYHKQVEASWKALQPKLAEGETAARMAALEGFLKQHPADHQFGNPRAADAEQAMGQLRLVLAQEQAKQAEEEARQKLRDALWPLAEDYLFGLTVHAGGGYPGERDRTRVLTVRRGEDRQMTRDRFGGPLPAVLSSFPLDGVQKALGVTLYTPDKGYNAEGLKQLFELMTPGEGDTLLGLAARQLYPYFAGAIAFHLRIHDALSEQIGPDTLAALRMSFLAGQSGEEDAAKDAQDKKAKKGKKAKGKKAKGKKAKLPPPPPPPGEAEGEAAGEGEAAAKAEPDMRGFYRELAQTRVELNQEQEGFADAHALEVGFWVRRLQDGTAPVLVAFLRGLASQLGQPAGEAAAELKVDGPTALVGDRMLRVAPGSWNAAAFSPDGQSVAHVGEQGLRVVRAGSGAEVYAKASPAKGSWEQVVYSASGRVIAAALSARAKGQKGHVYLYDAESGEQLADCGGKQDYVFLDLAFSHDDKKIIGRTLRHGLQIWDVGQPCTGIAVGVPPGSRPSPAFNYPMAVNPKQGSLVMARNGAVLVYDLAKKTETEVSRRENVQALSFSSTGLRLLTATDKRLFVETFNLATGLLSEPQVVDHRGDALRWLPGEESFLFHDPDSGLTRLWKAGADKPTAGYAGGPPLAVSPDRKTLLMAAGPEDLKVWALPAP